jgi:hypothetical protein
LNSFITSAISQDAGTLPTTVLVRSGLQPASKIVEKIKVIKSFINYDSSCLP